MCGILFTNDPSIRKNLFLKALLEMEHRGPDNNDSYFNENIKMGHTRLKIIDLTSDANQPFHFNQYHLIFNGEIYNYKELIIEHDLIVSTTSDTEVVLKMYIKFGEACLKYFNGMFSFVIYNSNTKDIFIARDRLGIKPLYIRENNGYTTVSSEIAPIINLYGFDFDEFGLRQYRKLRMTVRGYTIYNNIRFFPSGYFQRNNKIQCYWKLENSEKKPPTDEELYELIVDAVKLRNRSDVPVGSYLSGGLDSTILTYILNPTHTWTVGFKDLNEFFWSDLANKQKRFSHHKILVNKSDFINTGIELIKRRREPLSVPNEILIYLMTQEVKKENTVVLSGEGADELFWGYDRIFKHFNTLDFFDINDFESYYCYGSISDNEVVKFATEDLPGTTPVQQLGYFFQSHHLHGLLRRLDNSTMQCSVEARVPFVDHRLVERSAGVSFDWKVGKNFKEPLKRIFSTIIPAEICNRKKVGFPVPLDMIYNSDDSSQSSYDKWLDFNLDKLMNQ